MSNGQADFFRNMLPYARRVSERTGIDPRLVLAQSALETGYGQSAPNFNFFGIKAPQGQGASLLTSEFENGQMVRRNEPFRTYDSPAGSFEDYANLMLRAPRYRPVLEARTLEDQIAAMAASGYATDPQYGSKLSQIASGINLDDPGLIASDAMAAIGRGPNVSGMTATERPRPAMNGQPTTLGLLAQGAAPERPRRDIGNILDQLAIGFSGMSLRPNQGIVQLAQSRMEQREGRRQRNATADWLESQGLGAFAEGVRQGAISAGDALTFARGPEATAAQRNYDFMLAQGVPQDEALQRAFSGGTTVNVGGDGFPGLGKLATDYGYVTDPRTGAPIIDPETGLPTAAPIPGSATARQIEEAAAAAVEQEEGRGELTARAGNVVLDDINRIQRILDESELPVAGFGGALLRNVPGTNAYDVSALAQTIRANIGFDRLQQMREASPTGGALGSVSDVELATLQSVLGNLDQAQSQEQFERNLNRLSRLYTDMMKKFAAYPNASQFGITAPQSGSDISDEELLRMYGG
jgi:hypothetical protein